MCLKMVEPDSAVSIEFVEVDTLIGAGFIVSGKGTWSYRPPRIEIELSEFAHPQGTPRVNGELASSGDAMLLRVVFRQGEQFALTMERASRCGRIPG